MRTYAALLKVAHRFVRRKDEAEDLLQSGLLVAVQAGRSDISIAENRRWLIGILRNLAAFEARCAFRRQSRERAWYDVASQFEPETRPRDTRSAFANSLPPRLRTAALLMFSGHTRCEVAWLLRVSDMAVRQYVSEIKSRWKHGGSLDRETELLLSGTLAYGRIRQALRQHVGLFARAGDGSMVLASHDPDGYGFSITTNSQNKG